MTSSTTCARCGRAVEAGAQFCGGCGADVTGDQGGVATRQLQRSATEQIQVALLEALREATLGDYDILTELGRGGMATVYLAHDIQLDRKVAIKVISPAVLGTEGAVERFKLEARTAAALSHRHIIPIYTVRQTDQLVFFVMKFVEGRSLESIIKHIGPLPIPMVQDVLLKVGEALGYAHRHGVVHRDIKPGNIMIDEEGSPVVTDFGIAKVAEKQGLTQTGAAIGTPNYMSPEQCAAKKVTGASDQYSLGIVAYEMLTGKLPFDAESIIGIMYKHFNEPPPPFLETRTDCPPELHATVMRMLAKEPENRWPQIDEIVEHLGGGALGLNDPMRTRMIELAKSGEQRAILSRVSTPRSPIPIGATAAARSAKTVVKTGTTPSSPTQQMPAEAMTSERRSKAPWLIGIAAVLAIGVGGAWFAMQRTNGAASPSVTQPVIATTEQAAPPPTSAQTQTAVAAAAAPPAKPPVTRNRPAEPVRTAAASPAAPRPSTPGTDEVTARNAGTAAKDAKTRASSAGASTAELASGESEFQVGETLESQNRWSEAAARFTAAAALWSEVARVAQARAVATPREVVERVPAPPMAVTSPPLPPQPTTVEDARPQIEAVIQHYARAIESRDIAEVRRAYGGLTTQQQQGWDGFFKVVRDLKAELRITQLETAGDRAQAGVSGTYRYTNTTSRRNESTPVTFKASLERGPSGWRLTAIQ